MCKADLLEIAPVQDVYAEAIHHIEICGDNARVVYFRWRLADDGKTWQKIAVEVAIILPLAAVKNIHCYDVERRPVEHMSAH